MTRPFRSILAVVLPLVLGPAAGDERREAIEADVETVLELRRQLVAAIELAIEHHAELDRVAAEIRTKAHPAQIEIEALREAFANDVDERRLADTTARERHSAAVAAHRSWAAARRDALLALGAEHRAERDTYLVAKTEHDDLVAEITAVVDEFNAAAKAFNTGSLEGEAREAEAQRLRAAEARIEQDKAELVRRRDLALERYEALVEAEGAWRQARDLLEARSERAVEALAVDREALEAARAEADAKLEEEALRLRERVAQLEETIRADVLGRRSQRDAARDALVRAFGADHAALLAAVDRWLADGGTAGLYVGAGVNEPRFDRSPPRVEALYAAIERIEAPPPPRPLAVIEEPG